jgi:hypothetical protein
VDAHGLFYYKSKEKVSRVPDGTSNTLMFVDRALADCQAAGLWIAERAAAWWRAHYSSADGAK